MSMFNKLGRRRIGLVLLVGSVILLSMQFLDAFNTRLHTADDEFTGVVRLFAPYGLFLISLYLLFNQSRIPTNHRHVRLLSVLLASFCIAGGVFIVLLLLGFIALGAETVEVIFSKMLLILGVLTIGVFPFVYKHLK